MKPLVHPSPQDITVEGILHALSDPVRVRIFADIAKADCARSCCAFLALQERAVPKSTLSQHFRVLREAGLIRSERHGVELRNMLRRDFPERLRKLVGAILDAHAQCERVRAPKSGKKPKVRA